MSTGTAATRPAGTSPSWPWSPSRRSLAEPGERRAALFGALGGLAVAAGAASYVSGRVLPAVPVVVFLLALGLRRRSWRRVAVVSAAALLAGGVALAPLALHFARHP